ncbi:MAG TPA: anti-sigma factor [Rudaea sp.]|nr:anti-sigma factor [Rudaea sp.]
MTANLDTRICDSEAARLLPWLVTGRLAADEAARVESHLAECPICRSDLAVQHELRTLMQADERVEYAPQPSLQKLMTRIDELDREIAVPEPAHDDSVAPPRAVMPRWMIAAAVLQTVGLGLLGAALWQQAPSRTDPATYVTLSAADSVAAPAARVRVVFTSGMTAGNIARLLGAVHAEIVAGPSGAGAYTIALLSEAGAPPSVDASLARLRADPGVLFAEPVAGMSPTPQ